MRYLQAENVNVDNEKFRQPVVEIILYFHEKKLTFEEAKEVLACAVEPLEQRYL